MCSTLKDQGFCTKSAAKMRKTCARSCSFCSPCKDKMASTMCVTLKTAGHCTNPTHIPTMSRQCPSTCNLCSGSGSSGGGNGGGGSIIESTPVTPSSQQGCYTCIRTVICRTALDFKFYQRVFHKLIHV